MGCAANVKSVLQRVIHTATTELLMVNSSDWVKKYKTHSRVELNYIKFNLKYSDV
jgi:hypothetical protein